MTLFCRKDGKIIYCVKEKMDTTFKISKMKDLC